MKRRAQPWKIIGSRQIWEHGRIVVVEDTVELPNGETTVYAYRSSQTDSVIIIAVNARGRVLMQREYSHPPRTIMWQLPGGSMEKDEPVETAARRELAEESGYSARSCEVIGSFYTNNRNTSKQQHVVVCKDLFHHKLEEDHDEFIDSYWLTPSRLHRMIADNEISNINLLAALNLWFHKSHS